MSNTLKRVLSAVVLIPLVFLLLFKGSPEVFKLAMKIITAGLLWEYSGMFFRSHRHPMIMRIFLVISGLGFQSLFFDTLGSLFEAAFLVFVIVFSSLYILLIREGDDLKEALSSWALFILGIFYAGILMGMFYEIRFGGYRHDHPPTGDMLILFLFLIVWAGDSGAWFFGKRIGKRKLNKVLSPGKTWEGTICGFICSVVVGGLFFLSPEFKSFPGGVLGILGVAAAINVLGQTGDLFESFLKRSAGVKDSGNLIPGHGGLMDRLDSLLFAVVVIYVVFVIPAQFMHSLGSALHH
jgi:phosphatidate cytidylyltransferase